ncbi:MAG: DoxX family protein [Undibacterium sp.]|nr:DoxX family protein [Opitutaceae bacterium]
MKFPAPIGKLDNVLGVIAGLLQAPLLFVIRLFWGWQFMQTGWGKLMNLGRTTNFFESPHLSLPRLNAMAAGSVQCFGGALLLLGFLARFVSPALIFTVLVAYATARREALHAIFSDPDKFTGAAPFLFLAASVIVIVFGPANGRPARGGCTYELRAESRRGPRTRWPRCNPLARSPRIELSALSFKRSTKS